jgi:hypothetical protein
VTGITKKASFKQADLCSVLRQEFLMYFFYAGHCDNAIFKTTTKANMNTNVFYHESLYIVACCYKKSVAFHVKCRVVIQVN